MKFLNQIMNIWDSFCAWVKPVLAKCGSFFQAVGKFLDKIYKMVYNLRKVFAALPVAAGAIVLALYNSTHLPPVVGIGLQNDATFGILTVRAIAVLGPLAITALCLLLMFASKKILTPWLVSLFTLAVPVILLLTNTFPS